MPLPLSQPSAAAAPEKYLIAFVIQGDDVFKITADNIIHTTGTANGPAFDAIAKLKAAAALLELTNRHKERPDELRQMARELAGEGMKLMASASAGVRPAAPTAATEEDQESIDRPARDCDSDANLVEAVPVPSPHQGVSAPTAAAVAAPMPVAVPQPASQDGDTVVLPRHSRITLISG